MERVLFIWVICLLFFAYGCSPSQESDAYRDRYRIERLAKRLTDDDYDPAEFRRTVARVIGHHQGDGHWHRHWKELQREALAKLLAAATSSKNEEARRLVADLFWSLRDEFVTDGIRDFRDQYEQRTGRDEWWRTEEYSALPNGNALSDSEDRRMEEFTPNSGNGR